MTLKQKYSFLKILFYFIFIYFYFIYLLIKNTQQNNSQKIKTSKMFKNLKNGIQLLQRTDVLSPS